MVQLLINIIVTFCVLLLIGYSFRYIYSTLRFFHLAHAVTLTLGAYFVFQMSIRWGWPFWVSTIVSVFSGVLLMLLCHLLLYRPLKKRNAEGWQMMVSSLGVYVVLQNVVSLIWGDTRVTIKSWEVAVGHEILGGFVTNVQIITVVVCLLLVSLVFILGRLTNSGQKIQAVGSSAAVSSILGISSDSAIAFSMAIGTAMMAVAGILIAADVDMTPTMGFDWLLYGVVAMIIGGMGRMRHILLGALLLATAQHLSAYLLDSKWMNATAYVILIILLCFRPYGLSGRGAKKTDV